MVTDRAIVRVEPQGVDSADTQSEIARDCSVRTSDGAATTSKGADIRIDHIEGDFIIDAALIGELLNVPAADVPALMRSNHITGVCESGVDVDQGTFRLNLFHEGRHARLRIDADGRILQRSVIDFGGQSIPRRRRKAL